MPEGYSRSVMQQAAVDPAVMRRAWLVLAVVSLASFQTAMALSIIFVVYADLKESFPHASEAELSWVINSFTIVGAATLVICGVLGERWGRRRTLMAGIAVFTLASAGAALAPSTGVLIVARALQGFGTSLSLPMGAAIVIEAFPVARRGTGVGAWSANGAVAAAMGPSVGALLVHVGDWRWAFWLNVPFGVIALAFIGKVIQEHRNPQTPELPDRLGALMVLAGVGGVVFALVQSREWSWADPVVLAALIGGPLVLVLLAWRSMRHRLPIIDPSLFAFKSFRLGNYGMLVFSIAFFGHQFVGVNYLTIVWELTIFEAGMLLTPVFVFTGLLSALSGRWADRWGPARFVVAGSLMWTGGMVWQWVTLGGEEDLVAWVLSVTLAGIGSGLVWGSLFAVMVADLPSDFLASGSSVSQTMMRVGNAFGVAIAVTVIGATLADGQIGNLGTSYIMLAAGGAVTAVLGVRCTQPRGMSALVLK